MPHWICKLMRARPLGWVICCFLAFSATDPLHAQDTAAGSGQVLMNADSLVYDESTGVVTARGGVELAHGDRILIADLISYDQNTDTVTASGNVSLLEPGGEVIFSNYAVLENELKTGVH